MDKINKVATKQDYLILWNRGNKKDKNRNFWKIKLTYNKEQKLKTQKSLLTHNRRSIGTSCPWKTYTY